MFIDAPAAADASVYAHATAAFEFTIDAPLARVAPLFGALGERAWAGADWNPQFRHPSAPEDVEGAVFTVAHGAHPSVWVNTQFDLANARMQYVVFTPGVMATTIDVRLEPEGPRTRARVTYRRTALSADANAHVLAQSRADERKGPEWQSAIAAALAAQRR